MRRYFIIQASIASIALTILAFSCNADTFSPMVLSDIPLDKCTVDNLFIEIDKRALDREVRIGNTALPLYKETKELLEKYQGNDKPIKDILPPDELKRFKEISAETLTSNLKRLAESRVQRDVELTYQLMKLAEQWRDHTVDPKTLASIKKAIKNGSAAPDDEDAKKLAYLSLINVLVKDDPLPDPKIRNACNLDLALFNAGEVSSNKFSQQIAKVPQYGDLMKLRTKYKLSNGAYFDGVKLTKAETSRFQSDMNILQPLVDRLNRYVSDVEGIRRLMQISELKYQWNMESIEETGGIANVDSMNKFDRARYNELRKAMQSTLDIWYTIDKEMPSTANKECPIDCRLY